MKIESSKISQKPVRKTQRTYEKRIMTSFGINTGNVAKKTKRGFITKAIDFLTPKFIKEFIVVMKKNKELTEKNKELIITVRTLDHALGILNKK